MVNEYVNDLEGPALLPQDPAARARARLMIDQVGGLTGLLVTDWCSECVQIWSTARAHGVTNALAGYKLVLRVCLCVWAVSIWVLHSRPATVVKQQATILLLTAVACCCARCSQRTPLAPFLQC